MVQLANKINYEISVTMEAMRMIISSVMMKQAVCSD